VAVKGKDAPRRELKEGKAYRKENERGKVGAFIGEPCKATSLPRSNSSPSNNGFLWNAISADARNLPPCPSTREDAGLS
jgi:hypothetical protein